VRHEGSAYTTSNDLVGFLVDAIGDVVEADEATIEPPSANVSEAEGGFLSGVIKTDAGLLVLLDINEIMHGD
jgi:purine-binding chemotaxis protein CheW